MKDEDGESDGCEIRHSDCFNINFIKTSIKINFTLFIFLRLRPIWPVIQVFLRFQSESGRRLHLEICGALGEFRATIGIFMDDRTKIVDCSKSRTQEERREAFTLVEGLI